MSNPGVALPVHPMPSANSHVQALAARGVVRHFRPGAVLIQEGDQGDTLYIVQTGRIRVFAADESGKEITLGLYGPGELIGEMSLDGGPRSANVETLEASTCVVLTRDTMLGYIAEHPAFALEIIGRLIRRARVATQATRSLALTDVYQRFSRLLDEFAGPPAPDGSRTIEERMTQQQIANHLACSREMVSRLMKDLQTGGYVEMRDRRIVLKRALPRRW